MAYKFEVEGYYFKVTDTGTGDFLINETRESLKWTINDAGDYVFIQKGAVPQSVDGVSPSVLRIGRSFAFADIVDSGGSAFASETVLREWLSAYVGYICCSEISLEFNGVSVGTIPSGTILEVNLEDGSGSLVTPDATTLSGSTFTIDVTVGGSPAGATLMPSGAETVFRTGDDADNRLVNGRTPDFFTLNYTNPFGSNARFTDEIGVSTYTNNIVIDWSTYDNVAGTVLGYYRDVIGLGTTSWNNAIDNCLAFSVGTFTTGWRLVNRKELFNLVNDGVGSVVLNYSPFNISTRINISSSTTRSDGAPAQVILDTQWGDVIVTQNKATSQYYMPCRTFTVTGTTLT
jgi:hypothetical protein